MGDTTLSSFSLSISSPLQPQGWRNRSLTIDLWAVRSPGNTSFSPAVDPTRHCTGFSTSLRHPGSPNRLLALIALLAHLLFEERKQQVAPLLSWTGTLTPSWNNNPVVGTKTATPMPTPGSNQAPSNSTLPPKSISSHYPDRQKGK